MKNHSFSCIFQEFQYLIGFTLSKTKTLWKILGKISAKKNGKTLKF